MAWFGDIGKLGPSCFKQKVSDTTAQCTRCYYRRHCLATNRCWIQRAYDKNWFAVEENCYRSWDVLYSWGARYISLMLAWKILINWGRVTHISVDKLTIIGSYNGLSPERRQAIIWTNAGIWLIGPLGTNFSGILIEIQTFSLKKID